MAWLAVCLSIVCVIYACAALARPLTPSQHQELPEPRLQADYSPWLPTTFSPVLDALLLEAARDLGLGGASPRVRAEDCLLPGRPCTPGPEIELEETPESGQDQAGPCRGAQDGKCKPSAASAHP